MAKIIFQNENFKLGTNSKQALSSGFISEREQMKKRSKKYMETIMSLDTKSLNETRGMQDLMDAIEEEFGAIGLGDSILGIVAKCFLGHPHEVHTLDLCSGHIIRHFKIGENLPEDFEKARNLAKHNAYAFVEVYRDKLILVREDGTTSKI